MKLRVLPATIFFATLLLTVKIGNLWTGVGNLAPALQVADLRAQDSEDDDQAAADNEAEATRQRAPSRMKATSTTNSPRSTSTPWPSRTRSSTRRRN